MEETTRGERTLSDRARGLARPLALGLAFVAGLAFGRRSSGGESESEMTDVEVEGSDTEAVDRSSRATEQPSSMGSVAGEEEREDERETESEGERPTSKPETVETETEGEESGTETEPETDAAEQEYEEDVDDDIEPLLEATDVEVDEEVAALSAPTTRGMPMLGIGTYQMDEYDECFESVLTALEMGYRHVDTAEGYENEDAVGDAIAAADVDREDLFVATKVSPENLAYDRVITSAEESLERLGLDYVDLLYVHWPAGEYDVHDTLGAFAELREEGLIEKIGVSNFTVELLEEAIEVAEEPIFANQVEMHPLLPQRKLQQFCAQEDTDVELVAYSPIARGDVSDVDALREVAEKHDATPEQVSLAWLREKEVTAIPKATSRDHLRDNWLSLDVDLDDEDVESIDDIDREERLVDPDVGPWNE